MSNFSDRDCHRSATDGPWWPLDLIRSIGRRAKYFENAAALPRLLASAAETAAEPLSEAQACACGWALVEALLPTDFVAATGSGPEACDLYAIARPDPSAIGATARLQLGFMLYRFAGQPPILMISIAPLPAASAPL